MHMYKYSIIVPVYNAEEYLPACLDSILVQNYKNFEVILVNDGSKDRSLEICENYKKRDNRIVVINKENGGSTSSRKAGAKISSGDYIICIDSDDFIEMDYFSHVNELLNLNKVDVICFGYDSYYGNRTVRNINDCNEGIYEKETYEIFVKSFIYNKEKNGMNTGNLIYSLWSKVIRRDLFVDAQNSIEDKLVIGEDMLCIAKVLHSAKSLMVKNESYYFYRVLDSSIMRNFQLKKFEQFNDTVYALSCLDYIEKERLQAFSFVSLSNLIAKLVRNCSSIGQFRKEIKSTMKYYHLWENACSVCEYRCKTQERIKLIMFQRKLLCALYVYYKYK